MFQPVYGLRSKFGQKDRLWASQTSLVRSKRISDTNAMIVERKVWQAKVATRRKDRGSENVWHTCWDCFRQRDPLTL